MITRFRFVDAVLVLASLMVVCCLFVCKAQEARAHARLKTCADNMRLVMLGLHNYHSVHQSLPMGCGGTSAAKGAKEWQNNADRLSGWVGVLPFVEEQALWDKISEPYPTARITFPPMGPVPWYDPEDYKMWGQRPARFVCPSDKAAQRLKQPSSFAMCYGDTVDKVGNPSTDVVRYTGLVDRGAFVAKRFRRFRDFLDGLDTSVMISERCISRDPVAKQVPDLAFDPSACIKAGENWKEFWDAGQDANWSDGCLRSTGFQTILPPNSSSCTSKGSDLEGIMTASSHHVGGVHVGMGNRAVRFVSDSIDVGESDRPTVAAIRDGRAYSWRGSESPYGVWGMMGTIATRDDDFYGSKAVGPPLE